MEMDPGALHRAAPRWPASFPVLVHGAGGRLPIRHGMGGFAIKCVYSEHLFIHSEHSFIRPEQGRVGGRGGMGPLSDFRFVIMIYKTKSAHALAHAVPAVASATPAAELRFFVNNFTSALFTCGRLRA